MDVYINQAPEVEKSIFIIEIFGNALVWGTPLTFALNNNLHQFAANTPAS